MHVALTLSAVPMKALSTCAEFLADISMNSSPCLSANACPSAVVTHRLHATSPRQRRNPRKERTHSGYEAAGRDLHIVCRKPVMLIPGSVRRLSRAMPHARARATNPTRKKTRASVESMPTGDYSAGNWEEGGGGCLGTNTLFAYPFPRRTANGGLSTTDGVYG